MNHALINRYRQSIAAFTLITAYSLCGAVLAEDKRPVDDFPIAELQYHNKIKTIYLYHDYGFIVKWEADATPRFYVYDKPHNTIYTTGEMDAFLEHIGEFPDGSQVAWVQKCAGPFHTGMPENILDAIKNTIQQKKFKMAEREDNNYGICTCESLSLTLFEQVQTLQGSYIFSIDEPGKPVNNGQVWLFHYSHYGFNKFFLAEIVDGKTSLYLSKERLMQEVMPHANTDAYIIALQLSSNVWYRTPDIIPDNLFKDAICNLDSLGKVEIEDTGKKCLVLPAYTKRSITLIDQDGHPIVYEKVPVSVFISTSNHCGVHVGGIELGTYVTNETGRIEFLAPLVALYLDIRFYTEERKPGFAGRMFSFCEGLKVSDASEEEIKLVWKLPSEDYRINVKDASNTPMGNCWVEYCERSYECGAHNGSVGTTDSDGNVFFNVAPQSIKYLAIHSEIEDKYLLSEEELKTLIENKYLAITWEK